MKPPVTLSILLAILVTPLFAQDIPSKRVEFARGATGVTLEGKITGNEALDYVLGAKAGQILSVDLESATPSQNFNVLAPDGNAIHVGSRDGVSFSGKLPIDGDYTIRLYLMGNARDTDSTVAHKLDISITGDAAATGTDFDQTVSLQGISFRVMTAIGDDGKTHLRVTPEGLEVDNSTAEAVFDGTVTGAEAGDLNVDGSPEIYVFVRGPGDPAKANLLAWATNNRKSMSQIYFSPLADDAENSKGYRGGDQIAVVENVVAIRFPIYPDDPNATEPTGKTRQLQYKLHPGEAGWLLKLDKVSEY